jgi:hypothetical protein
VRSYQVVVDGRVPGPYTAETYPVTEERRLLYVEI